MLVGGPYIFAVNNECFLSVNDECVVGATTKVEDATAFYITQAECDEPALINYYKKTENDEHSAKLKVQRIPCYLQVSSIGLNAGSLEVQYNVRKASHCLFVFHDRLLKKPVGDMVETLANNNEGYYIKCEGVPDSFLAVVKQPGKDPLYETACRRYQTSFDDENVLMLFQIIRPDHYQFTETRSVEVRGIITQLKQYEVARLE